MYKILFIYIYIYSLFVVLDNKLYKMRGTYIKMDIISFNYDMVDVCDGPVFDPK